MCTAFLQNRRRAHNSCTKRPFARPPPVRPLACLAFAGFPSGRCAGRLDLRLFGFFFGPRCGFCPFISNEQSVYAEVANVAQ